MAALKISSNRSVNARPRWKLKTLQPNRKSLRGPRRAVSWRAISRTSSSPAHIASLSDSSVNLAALAAEIPAPEAAFSAASAFSRALPPGPNSPARPAAPWPVVLSPRAVGSAETPPAD